MNDFFGKAIYVYSRNEAIADGSQCQAKPSICSEVGIKGPVFLTAKVYDRYVRVPDEFVGFQDEDARLFDILYMFALDAKEEEASELNFIVYVLVPDNREWLPNEKRVLEVEAREVCLKSVIGPLDFDDPLPAITIMIPGED